MDDWRVHKKIKVVTSQFSIQKSYLLWIDTGELEDLFESYQVTFIFSQGLIFRFQTVTDKVQSVHAKLNCTNYKNQSWILRSAFQGGLVMIP